MMEINNIDIQFDELSLKEKNFLSEKKGRLQDKFYKKFGENKSVRFYNNISIQKLKKFNKLNKKIDG